MASAKDRIQSFFERIFNALITQEEKTVAGRASAAFFAARHDGGVEAFAEAGGQVVDFVGAVDLNGLARGVQGDFAVFAAAQVFLQVGAHLGRDAVVNEVVEQS